MGSEEKKIYGDPRTIQVFRAIGVEGEPSLDQLDAVFDAIWKGPIDKTQLPKYTSHIPHEPGDLGLRRWGALIVASYFNARKTNG